MNVRIPPFANENDDGVSPPAVKLNEVVVGSGEGSVTLCTMSVESLVFV